MTGPTTVYVLLVYSHEEGHLLSQENYYDVKKATQAYELAEQEHRGSTDYEIVLVGSDSVATIEKTHGHYFRISDSSLFSEFLTSS